MTKIGIIGAMEIEVSYLRSIMQNAKQTVHANLVFYEGTIKDTETVVVQSGIGKVNAAMCATVLIEKFGITHMINTGVAGGLRNDLHIFDVVISTDAMYHDFDVTEFGYPVCTIPGMKTSCFPADPYLQSLAQKAFAQGHFTKKITCGRIGTGDVFVNSAELKNKIRTVCNPTCVEMEGTAIAHVCYLFSVPFIIIRCISDMAENTEEVYHEEKAAEISAFVVEHMLEMFTEQ